MITQITGYDLTCDRCGSRLFPIMLGSLEVAETISAMYRDPEGTARCLCPACMVIQLAEHLREEIGKLTADG